MSHDNLYAVLGLRRDAESEVVSAAFRALAKKYHPDLAPGDKHVAAEKFNAIHAAFEVLSDPEKRKLYDASPLFKASKSQNARTSARDYSHAASAAQAPKTRKGIWKVRLALGCFAIVSMLKLSMVWFPDGRNADMGDMSIGDWQTDQALGSGKPPHLHGSEVNDPIIMKLNELARP